MGHPLLDLTSQTAVVIGGTSGIGLALARALAQSGANVVPTGRRTELVEGRVDAIHRAGISLRRCEGSETIKIHFPVSCWLGGRSGFIAVPGRTRAGSET